MPKPPRIEIAFEKVVSIGYKITNATTLARLKAENRWTELKNYI
jgi:hypothetical protein